MLHWRQNDLDTCSRPIHDCGGDDASFGQLQSLRQKDDPLEFSVGRWPVLSPVC